MDRMEDRERYRVLSIPVTPCKTMQRSWRLLIKWSQWDHNRNMAADADTTRCTDSISPCVNGTAKQSPLKRWASGPYTRSCKRGHIREHVKPSPGPCISVWAKSQAYRYAPRSVCRSIYARRYGNHKSILHCHKPRHTYFAHYQLISILFSPRSGHLVFLYFSRCADIFAFQLLPFRTPLQLRYPVDARNFLHLASTSFPLPLPTRRQSASAFLHRVSPLLSHFTLPYAAASNRPREIQFRRYWWLA